ncbi:MAG: thiolase family protein [Thermoleophilia bacterium]
MTSNGDPVVVVGGARTAIGRFGGSLKDVDAYKLGAAAIVEALSRSGVDPEQVDEVVMGQIGQVGPDAYNARRCAIEAGIPVTSTAMTVNRLCSSGLQAILSGAQEILTGQADVVVAGGDESMSRQPFLDFGARDGYRLGSRTLVDGTMSMVTDPFGNYPMGYTGEMVAERYEVGREAQDRWAFESQQKAAAAIEAGRFDEQIVPIDVPRKEPFVRDEHPRADTTLEGLGKLKAVFKEGGSITAGNSAGINDGGAAVVLMKQSEAERRGLEPRLVLRAWAVTGIAPEIMGYAPAHAIPKACEKAGITVDDLDVVELNEAFAAQVVAIVRDAGLDPEKVNPNGGAIALGHPVGATGAIMTVKLMHELERTDGRYGVVTMCIGGGQGMAAVFSRS